MLHLIGLRAGAPASLLAAALLSACGAGDDVTGSGGVTVGEARSLDEAGEMLDEQRLPAPATAAPASSPDREATAPAAEP